jgi:hypothetical protein
MERLVRRRVIHIKIAQARKVDGSQGRAMAKMVFSSAPRWVVRRWAVSPAKKRPASA